MSSTVSRGFRQAIIRLNSSSNCSGCSVLKTGGGPKKALGASSDWLKNLGMSEYTKPFAENKIDLSALRYLTDQDLKDIGVALGDRRKILAVISETAGAIAPTLETAIAPKPQDTAERRQVTVMFSDLVGSTALSARMDPEDLRDVISAYQKCVSEIVQRFGGYVAKVRGTSTRLVVKLAS
jgi:hypothetical protein